jgi:hypothetical protein
MIISNRLCRLPKLPGEADLPFQASQIPNRTDGIHNICWGIFDRWPFHSYML